MFEYTNMVAGASLLRILEWICHERTHFARMKTAFSPKPTLGALHTSHTMPFVASLCFIKKNLKEGNFLSLVLDFLKLCTRIFTQNDCSGGRIYTLRYMEQDSVLIPNSILMTIPVRNIS